MEFWDRKTLHEIMRSMGMIARDVTEEQYYSTVIPNAVSELHGGASRFDDHQLTSTANSLIAQANWIRSGRPYYKIWPGMIDMLSGVGLDLPCECLRLPFTSFLIRLPVNGNPLKVDDDGHEVRSIMVNEGVSDGDGTRRIFMWIDVGELEPGPVEGSPMYTYQQLKCIDGMTVEQAHESLRVHESINDGVQVPREIIQKCIKLSVAVSFLATGGDKLISPDILSKDLAAWLDAHKRGDVERIKTIEDRAERRGKKGYHIGQHDHLIVSRQHADYGDEKGSRGELTHSHLRRAHFRQIQSGRVVFIRPMVIRPDLPPSESASGGFVR